MMSTNEILARAAATFVQAFTGYLIGSGVGLLDGLTVWEGAAGAGLGAIVALAHRLSSRYLEQRAPR